MLAQSLLTLPEPSITTPVATGLEARFIEVQIEAIFPCASYWLETYKEVFSFAGLFFKLSADAYEVEDFWFADLLLETLEEHEWMPAFQQIGKMLNIRDTPWLRTAKELCRAIILKEPMRIPRITQLAA